MDKEGLNHSHSHTFDPELEQTIQRRENGRSECKSKKKNLSRGGPMGSSLIDYGNEYAATHSNTSFSFCFVQTG